MDSQLDLKFQDIREIGHLQVECRVLQLDLSYNELVSLKGLEQFRLLTHLNISHNKIQETQELENIYNKAELLVLSVKGNPMGLHPDIRALLIGFFPGITEIDGEKVHELSRRDILDGVGLAREIIPYFYENELFMVKLNTEIQLFRLKPADFEGIRQKHIESADEFPLLEVPTCSEPVRPCTIQQFSRAITAQLPGHFTDIEEDVLCKVYKWIYCELCISLHNKGYHELQCFLKGSEDLVEDSIVSDLLKFSSLAPTPASLVEFPVFACNSLYLQALYEVLYKQALALQLLLRERHSLCTHDFRARSAVLDDCELSPPVRTPQPTHPAAQQVWQRRLKLLVFSAWSEYRPHTVYKQLKSAVYFRNRKLKQKALSSLGQQPCEAPRANKKLLCKVFKSWLFLVRPSAKYTKKAPAHASSPLDGLLHRIAKKRKGIARTFKQLYSLRAQNKLLV